MNKNKINPVDFSSRHRKKIILSLMLVALVYLAVIFYIGYEQALDAFIKIGDLGWLLLLSSSFVSYLIRYMRWQFYLKQNGHSIPHHLNFLYYLSAFALTTTPGKAGETIRSVLLRPHGVPYHTSLACFFVERLLDLMIVTLLSLFVLAVFGDYTYFVIILTAVILAVMLTIRHEYFHNILSTWHHNHKTSRIGRFVGHVTNLLKHARELLSLKNLYIGGVLGLISWTIQAVAFYFIVIMLGFDINLLTAIGIYALALLAGAASFIPGGIGSTELVMGLLLSAAGADNTVAVTAPLISRMSTLWFAVITGLIATGGINWLRQQEKSESPSLPKR